jgi:hypothetical protein
MACENPKMLEERREVMRPVYYKQTTPRGVTTYDNGSMTTNVQTMRGDKQVVNGWGRR